MKGIVDKTKRGISLIVLVTTIIVHYDKLMYHSKIGKVTSHDFL